MTILALLVLSVLSPPDPHALVERALAAIQHNASLQQIHTIRLTGIQQEFILGNAERADGPWRASYSRFTELRDERTGGMRRTDESLAAGGGTGAPRVTILTDTVVASLAGGRVTGSSCGAYEDIIDRIDGSPDRALKLAAASPALSVDATVTRYGLTFDVVAFPWRNGRMKIEINRATHLPDAVTIVRPYPDNFRWNIFPAVTMRADYMDWTVSESGVYWPMQTKVSLNGQPLRDVTIGAVALDTTTTAADSFMVSDSARAQYARNSGLNFSRFPFGARGAPTERWPGIVRVPDQWAITLVKQPDGVVIFEAHISGRYLRDVEAEAHRRWPGSPIKAIVLSSDPWAHLGGFREAVAMGVPIYVYPATVPFLSSLVPTKHPRLVPVSARTIIGEGDNRIELYPVGGPYAEQMLMAYFPARRLLYGADLVFPNSAITGNPAAKGFDETPLVDLHAAVSRERLAVDTVFCVQNTAPIAWKDFVAARDVPVTSTGVVRPGDPSLITGHFGDESRDLEFQGLAAVGDSITFRMPLRRTERVVAGTDGQQLLITYQYGPPTSTGDSLVVDRTSLAPRHETLRLAGRSIDLTYSPGLVDIIARTDTGGAHRHTSSVAGAVFAFNEREQVIRSLPLAPGYQAILPLFSEIDERVEMDTVTVVGRIEGAAIPAAWRVRFADPAIVVTYDIDIATRRVLAESVIQRQSARRMRYVTVRPPR